MLVGMGSGTTAVENIWQLLKNIKIELLHDPANALLEVTPEELKAGTQMRCFTPMFMR